MAFLLWEVTREVKNTIGALTFRFGAGGVPKIISLSQIEIPIQVFVDNAGFTDLPLNSLNITLQRVTKTGSYPFAFTDPAGVPTPPIKARSTTRFTIPVRTEPLSAISEIFTSLSHLGVNRFAVTGTLQAAGLSLPLSPVEFTV